MSGLQPDSLDELNQRLSVAMSEKLGTYSFKNELGQTEEVPAIWSVRNLDTDPPNEFKKSGVECLIFPADPDSMPYFAARAKFTLDWLIRLIQHDRESDLVNAYTSVVSAYPNVRKQSHLYATIERNEQINLLLTTTRYDY